MKNILVCICLSLGFISCMIGSNSNGNGNTSGGDQSLEFKSIRRINSPNVNNIMQDGVSGAISDSYRIPAAIVTKTGRVIATSDARWGTPSDSANNIDSVYRYSDDGGKNWSTMKFLQKFDDFTDENQSTGSAGNFSRTGMSASFIDPGIVEAGNGDIVTVTTVFPWGGGLLGANVNTSGQGRVNNLPPYLGTHGGDTYLKLRDKHNTGNKNTEDTYEYRVKVSGAWAEGDRRPVTFKDGALLPPQKQLKVDKYYNVYNNDGTPLMIDQYVTGRSPNPGGDNALVIGANDIHANLFYFGNPYHVVPRQYLFTTRSTDNGSTFSEPKDVSWQVYLDPELVPFTQRFIGVSPGAGFRASSGRLLFAVQLVSTTPAVNCRAGSFYSDDHGHTWKIGTGFVNSTVTAENDRPVGRFSESQYLATPDPNQLLLMGRTSNGRVMYAVSMDNGITWSDPTNTTLRNHLGIGAMVGAANLYKTSYLNRFPMIAISHVNNNDGGNDVATRIKGALSLGFLQEGGEQGNISHNGRKVWVPRFLGDGANNEGVDIEGDDIWWTWANTSNPNEKFAYSMPVELPNGNIGLFYEGAGYTGGTSAPSTISWQEIELIRTGDPTEPIFPRP